jgi:hypothetical protein
MKRKLSLLAAVAAVAIVASVAGIPNQTPLTLAWNNNGDVDLWLLYGTNDVTAPLATWPLLVTVPGSITQAQIMTPYVGQGFYYLKGSNFWTLPLGVSVPSNVAATPSVLTGSNNLRVVGH